MKTVNVHEAKSTLSQLLAAVERGEEVLIARAGRPVARLTSLDQPGRGMAFGTLKGLISHMAEDFDAPLTVEEWPIESSVEP
ncbi:MAG: type II toxin-antitoxin system Phd/YefM family antitoxin [Burkholderiales bacterium]|nr:type II toxin-antitoxin system Phd/YefM family antitoxin [Burkholderiales bacterium]